MRRITPIAAALLGLLAGACGEPEAPQWLTEYAEAKASCESTGDEVCGGGDEDCDGQVDEGFEALGEACDGDDSDECTEGVWVCEGGALVCGDTTDDTMEACDAVDNDCDSLTDEGCDDDGDGFCDVEMEVFEQEVVCPQGTGDCDDTNVDIHPMAPELCDGLNNDCDDEVDEDFLTALGTPCDDDGDGCYSGVWVCGDDGQIDCGEGESVGTAEICDGLDNDCDGTADRDALGAPITEPCYDGADTTEGVGPCVSGLKTCDLETHLLSECVGQVEPADELCGDEVDNDCDGKLDEDFKEGGTIVAETPDGQAGLVLGVPCGKGVCAGIGGVVECTEDGVGLACSSLDQKSDEVCDELDNDCDDKVDEDFLETLGTPCVDEDGCATGTWICGQDGQLLCDTAEGAAGGGTAEVCDGLDNDCDGQTDEIFDLQTDTQHCGECLSDCASLPDAIGVDTWSCVAGQCLIADCDGAHWDIDGLVENGCEYTCVLFGDELCNDLDDDCDGTTDEPNPCVSDTTEVFGLCEGADGCQDTPCAPGTWNIDGAGFNGCEYTCTQTADLDVCDGGDEDCDGQIDEDGEACATFVVEMTKRSETVCARRSDGSVWCWGDGHGGILVGGQSWTLTDSHTPGYIPLDGSVTDVAVTGGTVFVRQDDGRVQCWGTCWSAGLNGSGVYKNGGSADPPAFIPDPEDGEPLEGVVAIETGSSHVCALMNTSELWCWGNKRNGRLGPGHDGLPDDGVDYTEDDAWPPGPVRWTESGEPMGGVIDFCTGYTHTCAIVDMDGDLGDDTETYCWGTDAHVGDGMTGLDLWQPTQVANDIGFPLNKDFVEVACEGLEHTCARTSDGTEVYCWGDNGGGQLGDGTFDDKEWAIAVLSAENTPGLPLAIDQLFMVDNASFGLTEAGEVVIWGGSNLYAQHIWTDSGPISGLTTSCLWRPDGQAYCSGLNDEGQLGQGEAGHYDHKHTTPYLVEGVSPTSLSATHANLCAVEGGQVRCWGASNHLGTGPSGHAQSPPGGDPVIDTEGEPIEAVLVEGGMSHVCAVLADGGDVVCWGNDDSTLGAGWSVDGSVANPITAFSDDETPSLTGVIDLSVSNDKTCAVAGPEGHVLCWGYDCSGVVPQGGVVFTAEQGEVLTGAVDVHASIWADGGNCGPNHACAVIGLPDAAEGPQGEVWCWGANTEGQLGDGTVSEERLHAAPVIDITADGAALTGAVQVATAHLTSCAITASGQLYCWGSDTRGMMGNGPLTAQIQATPIVGVDDAVELVAGVEHFCIRRESGAVACWGEDYGGALGTGTVFGTQDAPTDIEGLGPATALFASVDNTCAVTTDPTSLEQALWCWGQNDVDQMGQGIFYSNTYLLVPGLNLPIPTVPVGCDEGADPTEEVCDELDNDCDDKVDEGFDLQTNPAHCGACDNECGVIGIGVDTWACVDGACTAEACEAGQIDANEDGSDGCEYACSPSGDEVCDGVDNDCDNAVDEDIDPESHDCQGKGTGVCGTWYEPGTVTPIDGIVATCVDGEEICEYTSPDYESEETLCDYEDNDCDGQTDEAFKPGGSNPWKAPDEGDGWLYDDCQPQPCIAQGPGDDGLCSAVHCSTDHTQLTCCWNFSQSEACNDFDDDCDGETDEGELCESDGPASASTCEGGCVNTPCTPDTWDLDGQGQNGCEYDCEQSGGDESTCNDTDDDCDGEVDEDAGDCGLPATAVAQLSEHSMWVSTLGNVGTFCARRFDGSVWCWGDGDFGIPSGGASTNVDQHTPQHIPLPEPAVSVTVEWVVAWAELESGAIATWGSYRSGLLGTGVDSASPAPPTVLLDPTSGEPFTDIVDHARPGNSYAALVRGDGTLWSWGQSTSGKLGPGTGDEWSDTWPPTLLRYSTGGDVVDGVLRAAFRDTHACLLRDASERSLWCWGKQAYGRLGPGTGAEETNTWPPTPMAESVGGEAVTDVVDFCLGQNHGCYIREVDGVNKTWCWGRGEAMPNGSGADQSVPTPVYTELGTPLTTPLEVLACGPNHTCGLDESGQAHCWGDDASLGDGSYSANWVVDVVMDWSSSPIPAPLVSLEAGVDYTCGDTADGTTYCWGTVDGVNTGYAVLFIPADVTPGVKETVGQCRLHDDGHVSCRGVNAVGSLAQGEVGICPGALETPTTLTDLVASKVAVSDEHLCAIDADATPGEVRCWGYSGWDNTGMGVSEEELASGQLPIAFPGSGPIEATDIAAGHRHHCALLADGGVACWGDGSSDAWGGEGLGHAARRVVHESSGLFLDDATALDAGGQLACAVSGDDGTVYCWGTTYENDVLATNGYAQPIPTLADPQTDLTGAVAVTLNTSESCSGGSGQCENHACAVLGTPGDADTPGGQVWCWGDNTSGRLGDGTAGGSRSESAPVLDMTTSEPLVGVHAVAAAYMTTCALTTDPERPMVCWGGDDFELMANGPAGFPTTVMAKEVSSGHDADAISGGRDHFCITTAGVVDCWGYNMSDQAVPGGDWEIDTPTLIPDVPLFSSLTAGFEATCGVSQADGSVSCWGTDTADRFSQCLYYSPDYLAVPGLDAPIPE